jgi:hypothetical protein
LSGASLSSLLYINNMDPSGSTPTKYRNEFQFFNSNSMTTLTNFQPTNGWNTRMILTFLVPNYQELLQWKQDADKSSGSPSTTTPTTTHCYSCHVAANSESQHSSVMDQHSQTNDSTVITNTHRPRHNSVYANSNGPTITNSTVITNTHRPRHNSVYANSNGPTITNSTVTTNTHRTRYNSTVFANSNGPTITHSDSPDKQLTCHSLDAEKQLSKFRKHPIKPRSRYRGCTPSVTLRKMISGRAKQAKPTIIVYNANEQPFGNRSVVVDEQSDHPKCQTKSANVNGQSKTNQQLEATRANRLTVMTPRQQSQQCTVTDPANVKPDQQLRVMINSPEAMVSIEANNTILQTAMKDRTTLEPTAKTPTEAHIHAHELQKALVTCATAAGKGNDVIGRCLTSDGNDVMRKALQSYRATMCNANTTQSEVDTANFEMTQLYSSVQHLTKPIVQPCSNTTTHSKPHQINESLYVNGAASVNGQECSTEHDLGTPNGTASAQPDRPSDDNSTAMTNTMPPTTDNVPILVKYVLNSHTPCGHFAVSIGRHVMPAIWANADARARCGNIVDDCQLQLNEYVIGTDGQTKILVVWEAHTVGIVNSVTDNGAMSDAASYSATHISPTTNHPGESTAAIKHELSMMLTLGLVAPTMHDSPSPLQRTADICSSVFTNCKAQPNLSPHVPRDSSALGVNTTTLEPAQTLAVTPRPSAPRGTYPSGKLAHGTSKTSKKREWPAGRSEDVPAHKVVIPTTHTPVLRTLPNHTFPLPLARGYGAVGTSSSTTGLGVYSKSGRDPMVPKASVAMDSNNMYTVLRELTETADQRTCTNGETEPTSKAYDTPLSDIQESTCEDQGWTTVKNRASTRLDRNATTSTGQGCTTSISRPQAYVIGAHSTLKRATNKPLTNRPTSRSPPQPACSRDNPASVINPITTTCVTEGQREGTGAKTVTLITSSTSVYDISSAVPPCTTLRTRTPAITTPSPKLVITTDSPIAPSSAQPHVAVAITLAATVAPPPFSKDPGCTAAFHPPPTCPPTHTSDHSTSQLALKTPNVITYAERHGANDSSPNSAHVNSQTPSCTTSRASAPVVNANPPISAPQQPTAVAPRAKPAIVQPRPHNTSLVLPSDNSANSNSQSVTGISVTPQLTTTPYSVTTYVDPDPLHQPRNHHDASATVMVNNEQVAVRQSNPQPSAQPNTLSSSLPLQRNSALRVACMESPPAPGAPRIHLPTSYYGTPSESTLAHSLVATSPIYRTRPATTLPPDGRSTLLELAAVKRVIDVEDHPNDIQMQHHSRSHQPSPDQQDIGQVPNHALHDMRSAITLSTRMVSWAIIGIGAVNAAAHAIATMLSTDAQFIAFAHVTSAVTRLCILSSNLTPDNVADNNPAVVRQPPVAPALLTKHKAPSPVFGAPQPLHHHLNDHISRLVAAGTTEQYPQLPHGPSVTDSSHLPSLVYGIMQSPSAWQRQITYAHMHYPSASCASVSRDQPCQ